MEWVIVDPASLHDMCGLLGYATSSGNYHIKRESCEDAVDELLAKLSNDGPSLQTRRSLGVFQVLGKDLVPLLIAASGEHPKVVPKLIKLLSHLTSPIECLLPTNFANTDEGKQVAYELDSLLRAIKLVFTDFRATKAIVDYLKVLTTKVDELSPDECEGVSDGLLLLRNILHIAHKDAGLQNQILWNLFAHSLDKILLHLMTCSQKNKWGIALVQLIALIYKDQHVSNLQKLLNEWLENSMSESSEDNESNTSPPDPAASRGDSSSEPTLTSDPTSDSSDTGRRRSKSSTSSLSGVKSTTATGEAADGVEQNCGQRSSPSNACTTQNSSSGMVSGSGCNSSMRINSPGIKDPSQMLGQKVYTKPKTKGKGKNGSKDRMSDVDSGISSSHFSTENKSQTTPDDQQRVETQPPPTRPHTSTSVKQEIYSQQEGNSTSSNEDDPQQPKMTMMAKQRPIKLSTHAKIIPKLRVQPMITVSIQDKSEMRKKKLHKRKRRDKTSIKALVHHNPTDEDISLVLREFTVDFLLKGYGSLVALLQEQLSRNASLQVDKSHFLWLITYFLKFASQIELDLELISPVLSNDMLSYLTFEGVAMCENLAVCKDDLKPHLRRMHLVVTAIRELVHAVEVYSKHSSYTNEDKFHLTKLQGYMLNVEELRYLFLLLIRHFKPGVQSKQYLQDLITTNHVFLLLVEKISNYPEYDGQFKMTDFIKEFASPLVMQQYGHLLEDFRKNGEFVNDCVFTMMHHIAGDLSRPEVLYQPLILKTFSNIWEVEFEVKDDWADLIEYVIQRFMKSSRDEKRQIFKSGTSNTSDDNGWSKEDLNNLYWYYTRCATTNDPIGKIMDLYGGGSTGKTRESILNQLLHQRIIGYNQFLKFLASEKMETGDSNGVGTCDIMSTTTSSSHATAGSSCHSVPTSVLMDHLRDANQSSFSFQKSEAFPFSIEVEDGVEMFKSVEIEDSCGEHEQFFKEEEDPEVETVSASLSANTISPPSNDYSDDPPSTPLESSEIPMDICDLDIALGELVNQISGEGQDLAWLQKQVLEACHVKFNFETNRLRSARENAGGMEHENVVEESEREIVGPIPYHYTLLGQSIPIVPWTHYQEILLMSPPYLLLLHKLGFHLPGDVGKMFPRIPHFWTSDVLLAVANKLGPIPSKEVLNFDLTKLMELMESHKQDGYTASVVSLPAPNLAMTGMGTPMNEDLNYNLPGIGVAGSFIPGPASFGFGSAPHTVNWMDLVHKSKQIINRHSDSGDSSSSESLSDESEHMDDCASLKALPPTDQSEDVTMMSEASAHEDDDEGDDEDDQVDL
ncbi:unnamed protein product [Orchesella dallaii]